MRKKVLIAAGGSGGHIIPAQVVASELQEAVDVHFAGHALSTNRYLNKRWTSTDIAAAPLSSPLRFVGTTVKGICQAWSLRNYDYIIGFGSYHTVPILSMACFTRTPFVLYEANAVPGRVIRLFSPFAQWTAGFFEEAQKHLRGNFVHVDHPIRAFFETFPSQKRAREQLGLSPDRKTLLILGGSQGSAFFNTTLPKALLLLSEKPSVIHITGHSADRQALKTFYQDHDIQASVHAYYEDMPCAYAACDAVISRSGASAIREIELSNKAALYVPYPHATDNHQYKNACLAAVKTGAALVEEHSATIETLASQIDALQPPKRHSLPQKSFSSLLLKEL